MRKLSWVQTTFSVAVVFLAAVVLKVLFGWMSGEPPYVQFLMFVHNDIPRFTVPARLVAGTPVSFQARIVRKYGHSLNLLVYFSGKAERAVVEEIIGGPIGQSVNARQRPGKLP